MPVEGAVNLNLAMQNVHHHLERLMGEAWAATGRARGASDHEQAHRAVRASAHALLEALGAHHRAEDQVLFPRVARTGPEAARAVEEYSADHDRVIDAMKGVEAALGEGVGQVEDLDALRGALTATKQAMKEHFAREEKGIDIHLDQMPAAPSDVDDWLGSTAWREA